MNEDLRLGDHLASDLILVELGIGGSSSRRRHCKVSESGRISGNVNGDRVGSD